LQLLDTHLPPNDQRLELVTLLNAWIAEEDSEEQRETGEYLVRVLDENRLPDQKLFPPELKGVTWWATAAMRQAAVFWAQARQQGQPTADDRALDGDVILAAQAITLGVTDVVIATTNVGHLSRLAPAALQPAITPA
jgi:hypothetical protein